jgi:hypothetical protein
MAHTTVDSARYQPIGLQLWDISDTPLAQLSSTVGRSTEREMKYQYAKKSTQQMKKRAFEKWVIPIEYETQECTTDQQDNPENDANDD